MKNWIRILIFLISINFLLTGCLDNTRKKDSKLTVAVSILPQKTFVEAIAGDLVDVVVMIPPGYSPANYQPTPNELKMLSRAKIYFSIGVPTEQQNILPKIDEFNSNIRLVKLDKNVAEVYEDRYFDGARRDPHIWLSIKRVKIMIKSISKELALIDEANRDIYNDKAQSYIKRLNKLDKKIQERLKKHQGKSIIIYHPSLGYFTDDYMIKMVSIEKNGNKATPKYIKEIVDYAKTKNIKVVYYQAEIDSKQSDVLAKEIGGKAIKIAPLSPDYINNMEKISELIYNSFE